jgi:type II secretory pathway pseudopilin PulG
MRVNFKFRNCKITKLQNSQRGYILITLMLAVALAAIALLAVLPRIEQQIQRDREEEMRHRGTAYMRAIQHFYKKFGRYPTRVEELENTNQIRFLRKRYKDPITGKDFKLLHQQDISLNNGPLLGGPGGLGGLAGGGPLSGSPLSGPGGLGGALGQALQQGGALGGAQRNVSPQPQSEDEEGDGQNAGKTPPASTGGASASGDSPSDSSASDASSSSSKSGSASSSGFNGPVFGGGPIVGVASTSKGVSIREFNKKNHYNDWLFIYDPSFDRGGLLVGPWQPASNGGLGSSGLGTPVQNMQPGMNPSGNSPFGGPPQGLQQPPQNQPQPPGENEN